MCNNYEADLAGVPHKALEDFVRAPVVPELLQSWSVFPGYPAPIVRLREDSKREVAVCRWGFLRQWPDPQGRLKVHVLNNAQGETVDRKPTFKKAFARTRALIPCTGYFEWPTIAGKKTRTRVSLADQPLMGLAGLWEVSKDPNTGEGIETFTMLTTEPNDFTRRNPYTGGVQLHHRMPLILAPGDFDAWLDPRFSGAKALIVPYAANEAMHAEKLPRSSEPAGRK